MTQELIDYEYQANAENQLYHLVMEQLDSPIERNKKNNIQLTSCVGSGKTKMLAGMMDKIISEYKEPVAIIYITIADNDQDSNTLQDLQSLGYENVKFQSLAELELAGKIEPGTCTVIGWQAIKSKNSKHMQKGEQKNFASIMEANNNNGLKIIEIRDEAHKHDTKKADELQKIINPYSIVLSTATPKTKGSIFPKDQHYKVTVRPETVAESGKIKREVCINDADLNFLDDKTKAYLKDNFGVGKIPLANFATWDGIIYAAANRLSYVSSHAKQFELPEPLMLITLPNDSKSTKRDDENNVAKVLNILYEYGAKPDEVVIFVSDAKEDGNGQYVDSHEIQNRTQYKYVITKLAASTGWNCPRACVLARLRTPKQKSETLDIQTLGRIYRTSDPVLWRENNAYQIDEILNTAYIYTYDDNYSAEALGVHIKDEKLAVNLRPEFRSLLSHIKLNAQRPQNKECIVSLYQLTENLIAAFNKKFPSTYKDRDDSWNYNRTESSLVQEINEIPELLNEMDSGKTSFNKTSIEISDEVLIDVVNKKIEQSGNIARYKDAIEEAITNHIAAIFPGTLNNRKKPIKEDRALYDEIRYDFYWGIYNNFDEFTSIIKEELKKVMNIRNTTNISEYIYEVPTVIYECADNFVNTALNSRYAYNRKPKDNFSTDSDTELRFIKQYLENDNVKMKCWFKNGTMPLSDFSIIWNDPEIGGREFFTDFLTIDINNNLYLLETKNEEETGNTTTKMFEQYKQNNKGKAAGIFTYSNSVEFNKMVKDMRPYINNVYFYICKEINGIWHYYDGNGDDYENNQSVHWKQLNDLFIANGAM